MNGILLMCLNIGITPPDVSKPKKCAVMEAWTDPFAQSPKKSLEIIGLQHCFLLLLLLHPIHREKTRKEQNKTT